MCSYKSVSNVRCPVGIRKKSLHHLTFLGYERVLCSQATLRKIIKSKLGF